MKKILFFIFLITFCINQQIYAYTPKEELKIQSLITQMNKTKSIDDYNTCMDYIIYLNKKYEKQCNMFNDTKIMRGLEFAIIQNMERYKLTKDVKYNKNAIKYTDYAIANGTKNVNAIIAGMVASNIAADEKNLIKYYDYLCRIDNKTCQSMRNSVSEQVQGIKDFKLQAKTAILTLLFASGSRSNSGNVVPKTQTIQYGFNAMGDYVPTSVTEW